MAAHSPVRTPSPSRFKTKGLVDSPFSDYYTETSSPEFSPESKTASPFQRKLLSRLNSIGTQVLRRALTDDASKDIEVGLDALENRIQAPEVKSREPADVADSGLFIDDDDDDDDDVYDSQDNSSDGAQDRTMRSPNGVGVRMSDSPEEELLDSPAVSVKDFLTNKVVMDAEEAQAVVQRVTGLASELRKRYEEVRDLNDQIANRLETASNEVLHLRSENEALRADLSFDHSELLYLKLQLKAVQLSVDPHLPGDGQYSNSVSKSLNDGLERWKKDWKDVDQKFQARRAKYSMGDFPSQPDTPITKTRSISDIVEAETAPTHDPSELRMPKKIISIRRPLAPRSFTSLPSTKIGPLPAEPPTPSLTSESESGEDGPEHEAEDGQKQGQDDLLQQGESMTDSSEVSGVDRTTKGGNGKRQNSEHATRLVGDSEDLVNNGDYMEQNDSGSETEDEVDVKSGDEISTPSTIRKTPWQELWDGLAEIAGMRADDD